LKGIVDSINTMDPGLRKLLIPLVGKAVPATFTALVVLAKVLALGGVVVVGGTVIGLYALSEETEAAGLKAIESDDLVEGLADLNQQDGIDLNDSLRDLDSFIALMNSGDVDEGNPVVVNFRKMTRFGGVSWIRGGRKEYYERLKAKCIDSGICTEIPSSSRSKKSPNKTTSEKSNILSRTLNGFTLPSNAPQGLIERLKKLRTTEPQANQIQDALTLYSELKTNNDPRAVKLESRLIKISNDPDKRNFKSLEKVLDEIR